MSSQLRNLAVWVIVVLLLAALFHTFQNQSWRAGQISYSEFVDAVKADKVVEATITGSRITGTLRDGGVRFQTTVPGDPAIIDQMRKLGVKVTVRPADDQDVTMLSVLLKWFPMLLLIAVWVFFMRRMQRRG